MDPMYDFPMFEHGIHDTNQKLQYYRNIVVFLLGELKTLQAAMCTSCKEKCGSSPATGTGGQSVSTPNDLPLELRPLKRNAPALPPIAEMDTLCRTPQASSSGSPPINFETTASNSIVEISAELGAANNVPTFYARKDDLADTEVDVEFVHSFLHEAKSVFSLCFSRDGSYLAVATEEDGQGSIVMYEMESRAKYCELGEYGSQYGSYKRPHIWSLCFSANGSYLPAGNSDSRLVIWDIPNRRIRSIFQGDSEEYLSEIRFSPNGRLVAFCVYSELAVLNVRDNSRKMMSWWCRCFDFSPDGRHIATGDADGNLAMLDVRTGKAVKRWNAHGTLVFGVKFTSDGKGLLCSYDDVIQHWDLNEAEPILIWKSDTEFYFCNLAISPDKRLLAASNELRDVNSGKLHCTLDGHIAYIHSVDFSAAGNYFAMGDWDGIVSLWKYAWT